MLTETSEMELREKAKEELGILVRPSIICRRSTVPGRDNSSGARKSSAAIYL